jgi:hypothetical protein
MHGLVTLLPQTQQDRVKQIWQQLKELHGLTGIEVTPFPHFSWQIGAEYDLKELEGVMDVICASTPPFTAHTAGLGLFSGGAPVIFIPVVKNRALLDLHSRVWEEVLPVVRGVSPYYNPDNWCPHISLAYSDVTRENIGAVMQTLAFMDFGFEFEVNNLTYIHEPEGAIGELRLNNRLRG